MSKFMKKIGDGEILKFSLLSTTSNEKFCLWDVKEKKFLKEGNDIMLDTTNGKQSISRYIKLTPDEKRRYQRVVSFSRNIVVDGEEKVYDFPVSVEKQLNEKTNFLESLGINPLSCEFELKRSGTGLKTTYALTLLNNGDKDADSETVVENDDEEIMIDSPKEVFVLTDKEQKIVNKIKMVANDRTKEEKKNIFLNNGVSEERATEIVKNFFK